MASTPSTTEGTQRMGHSRLGRGLNALFDAKTAGRAAISAAAGPPRDGAGLKHIDVELIESNPFQPRVDFDDEALQELVSSLRTHGMLQPLLVRPHGDAYQLVAGERRLRAARLAGLSKVPCFVRNMEDREVNEAALEENIKREDLNVLEKAEAFRRYLDTFGGTINELAQRLSMTRSNVNNILRLLDLSPPVKDALRAGRISYGHARCLLALDEAGQAKVLAAIERQELSVRATEALVRRQTNPQAGNDSASDRPDSEPAAAPTNHILSLQQQLRDRLQARVEIRQRKGESGQIIIHFQSNDDFERLIRILRRAS